MGKPHKTSGSEETAQFEDDDQDRFSQLATTDDFKEFVRIAVATGTISQDELDSLDEIGKARLLDKLDAWLKAGKPRPQMPKAVAAEEEIIQKIYRTKSQGDQYLYYVKQGSDAKVGIDLIPVYAKIDGPDGKPHDDTSRVIERKRKYTTPYTKNLAEELIAKAKRHSDDVKLFFVQNNVSIAVRTESNFTGDFDELFNKALTQRIAL